jgi:hypothetical protein
MGFGSSGGHINCNNYDDSRWRVYADFIYLDEYWCYSIFGSTDLNATNQLVEVIHGSTANGCLASSWTFSWQGNFKGCFTIDGVYGIDVVGGEARETDPLDIDVRDRIIKYRIIGGTWTDWYGTFGNQETECHDAAWYSTTRNSANDFRFHD